jgi:hypothetical protein
MDRVLVMFGLIMVLLSGIGAMGQESSIAPVPSAEYEAEEADRAPASIVLDNNEIEIKANSRDYPGGKDEEDLKVIESWTPPKKNLEFFEKL